jgi:formylmethanofuran--tetrahydromethanopterin N-formyltransferase
MPELTCNGVAIDDGFAEAFDMRGAGLIITAGNRQWARQAGISMTGFATSVIGCGVEAAIDADLDESETPDGRPGIRVLLFAASSAELLKQVQNRVGQCILTCPGTACYAGLEARDRIPIGDQLRYFGDGWQISKRLGGKRYWRLPVMDGEFVCEADTGMTKEAVGGGNLLLMGRSAAATLFAAEAAAAAVAATPGAIAPFPGGVVRSGSKVGGKYKKMIASTNDAYCPMLRAQVATALDATIHSVLEVVIDGLTSAVVAEAMRRALAAVIALGPEAGAARIGAGNYGGKLGRHHYHLRALLP